MSSPHVNKPNTLTTLPLSILVRILRYVCPHPSFDRNNRCTAPHWVPFRDPRVTLSLYCAQSLTVQLPHELLPPALASPVLAAAVAKILGDRVSYLTHRNTGGQLSTWLKAFAPYVKAVSMEKIFPDAFLFELRSEKGRHARTAEEAQLEHSVHLLRTITIEHVRLEVLDLQDVHFLGLKNAKDDFMAAICATLEANSETLRELALPVFRTLDVCDRALRMSQLKKLDVLTVKIWPMYAVNASEPLASPVLRVMRAVDGHADRSRKLTTLRELSFVNVDSLGYPSLTASDRKSSVFLSVKTLRVLMLPDTDISDDNDLFICLFKNLERLYWNINPSSSDMCFENLCTKIPQVHLCGLRWITAPIEVGAEEHYEVECNFFAERSYDGNYGSGAIVSVYAGAMSGIDIRTMMTYCPKLENLSVHVRRNNIRAIRKLVAKCQQMKCLELVYEEREDERLEAEDWHKIARVIPKSHRNLCQVAIQSAGLNERNSTAIESVFECFERVTKALGDRAKRLAFRALLRTRRGVRLMEKVCDLFSVCIEHTPALESLEIRPYIPKGDVSNYNLDRERGVVRRLMRLENRLLHEVRSLRTLDVGVSPSLLRRISRCNEYTDENLTETQIETDSTGSHTECTSSSFQTT